MRWDIVNSLIEARGYKKYLEIGVKDGQNFFQIEAPFKVGVDPDKSSKATFFMESDQYFKMSDETYDIVFIDGLHLCEQVHRDILNSLAHLRPGGVVVLHDMLPETEQAQLREMCKGDWNGDCWKAFVKYRKESPFECYTVDQDFGCAVVDTALPRTSRVDSLPESYEQMLYSEFIQRKVEWMNVKDSVQSKEV